MDGTGCKWYAVWWLVRVQVSEEIKFEPKVMIEKVDRRQTFHQAQLEHGDILLVQPPLSAVHTSPCNLGIFWPMPALACKLTVRLSFVRRHAGSILLQQAWLQGATNPITVKLQNRSCRRRAQHSLLVVHVRTDR